MEKTLTYPIIGEIIGTSKSGNHWSWRVKNPVYIPWLGYSADNVGFFVPKGKDSQPSDKQISALTRLINEHKDFKNCFEKVIFDAYSLEIRDIYLGEGQMSDPKDLPLIKCQEDIWQVIDGMGVLRVSEDAAEVMIELTTIYDPEHSLMVRVIEGKPASASMG